MLNTTFFRLAAITLTLGVGTGSVLAQSTTDWSGFYAGIYGGYGIENGASASSSIGPASIDAGGTVLAGTLTTQTGRFNGLVGGAIAGYNYQQDRLVLGLEAGLGLGTLGRADSTVAALSASDGVNTATIDYSDKADLGINWYATLTGRLGFTHDSWLFYLKGGMAMADASVTTSGRVTISDPGGVIGIPALDLPSSGSASQLLIGPVFGFGAETMITDAVSVSAEYNYVGLPAMKGPSGLLGGLFGGGGARTFEAGTHQIKAGVNYHF